MRQARGVSPAQLIPQLAQDVVGDCVEGAQGAGADDVIGHQQDGLVGLGHSEWRRRAHAGAPRLQGHECGVLGCGAHRQAELGRQPLDADAVPQGGDETGDLAVGVQDGDVVASARGVPYGIEPVNRGAALGQCRRGGLRQDRCQVDVVGPGDRRGLLREQRRGDAVGLADIIGGLRVGGQRIRVVVVDLR